MANNAPAKATANIGVVGMAVMGSNLARNLASRTGNTVAIYNRSAEKTHTLVAEQELGVAPTLVLLADQVIARHPDVLDPTTHRGARCVHRGHL